MSVTNEEERDDLISRVQGIIGQVKPKVKHELDYGCDEGHPILLIKIPVQAEPVFYSQGRPYIRDGRNKRIAEPEEVKEKIHQHPTADYIRERERMELDSLRAHHANMQQLNDTLIESQRSHP